MSNFTLITGGARSGKSTFAERLAAHSGRPVIYIATAQVLDEEMTWRVKKHQHQRPDNWQLIEEPFAIPVVLEEIRYKNAVVLLDCVTIWLSNLLLKSLGSTSESLFPDTLTPEAEEKILEQVQKVATLAQEITPQIIMVTNEVGQGIVPDNPMARSYRDLAGRANQLLARQADKVFYVVAGYPIEVKQSGQELLNSLNPQQERP
ncbi:bifunctional adenosylcobinamide kinase/adenosylcobinamide-phosphate guanylyltransferase [Desulfitobacterium sp.]|uniref:bifunctional adenosylcobinamide kinase/adenosylcobinamide-phosphate guanylyltransferase n=1 Tax=Desulfitobacterium sp. TaxID=49981 RepID=UPI002B5BB107|nr:bifunctional adenosylcobinamide kinase/adenosylcobinamide-phosphate guanylyltransferase [Desulfitobacterium sp.]HVJ47833.1 bifunctional adenosylcobinamide kinase/adenosylcobinamide-phosphate guanylyltransferase [Desulfitobacterium sp.]